MNKEEIQKLKEAKDAAWKDYLKLSDPASVAYKKHQKLDMEYKETLLYEKAKRQVVRELINSAGKVAKMES